MLPIDILQPNPVKSTIPDRDKVPLHQPAIPPISSASLDSAKTHAKLQQKPPQTGIRTIDLPEGVIAAREAFFRTRRKGFGAPNTQPEVEVQKSSEINKEAT